MRAKCSICGLKYVSFNFPGQSPKFCGDCKSDGMVLIGKKMCVSCGEKQVTYNLPGLPPQYCGDCRKEGMINVKVRRCDGCRTKIPSFNYPDESKPIYCDDCKLPNMVNVASKKCVVCDEKQPLFNYPDQKIPTHCSADKLPGMVDVFNPKCVICGVKYAKFRLVNNTKRTHCVDCKTNDMIDPNPRCIECGLTYRNPKYKKHCCRCYIYKFPDESISKVYMMKEKYIVDFIKNNFSKFKPIFNKQTGGCSKRRPDVYFDMLTHIVIIEIDENQHIDYDEWCEVVRVNELFTDFGDRPIIFIRFNPDKYYDKNKILHKSCFGNTHRLELPCVASQFDLNFRLNILKNQVTKSIASIVNETQTIYLFYDGY